MHICKMITVSLKEHQNNRAQYSTAPVHHKSTINNPDPQPQWYQPSTLSYLTGYWRKISLQPLSDCSSPGTKIKKSSVLWNKTLSEKFSVSNGVTGGISSPILFIVYIDELLIWLQSQAVGYHWSHYFAGAFGYTDDIVLLAPSASALQMMLNARCQFVTDYNLIFNLGKTQLVRFSLPSSSPSSIAPPIFMFGGQSLTLVDRASHLGHILRSDLSDTDDILRVQTDMCRRANCLLSTFSATNPAVKTLLFHTFCLSLYGSSLWSLASPDLRSLEVTFNNILRKIWKLPRKCRTNILHCESPKSA